MKFGLTELCPSDKGTSTTFQVVHRPQNDPKIHDETSSSAVFKELAPTQSHKVKNRQELELELFDRTSSDGSTPNIRQNEGEAAQYGVYFDDTEYDYMQHMRDPDSGEGEYESCWVEAKNQKKKGKGKSKMSLEEALKGASLEETQNGKGPSKLENYFGEDTIPSDSLRPTSYQNQQDIPDALAGFQPDMDPRLREVLEALEDEAYVDDEEDFFARIAEDSKEISPEDFQDSIFPDDEDDDGWESDATEKPDRNMPLSFTSLPSTTIDEPMSDAPPPPSIETRDGGDWMKEFSKFKQDQNSTPKQPRPGELQSSVLTGASSLTTGRRKKRKGAMTSSTGYSMTSSSLARTEGLSLLDARFDKIEEMYAEEDDDMDMDVDDSVSMCSKKTTGSKMSNRSSMSAASKFSASGQAPDLMSQQFGSVMEEFLGEYSAKGGARARKGVKQKGMLELDEVRSALGPARLRVE